MTLADFQQGIADITGQFDSNSTQIYGRFTNNRYKMLWERTVWNDSIDSVQTVTGVGTPYINLPSNLEWVLSIRCKDHFLDPSDETFFVETDPSIFERTGIPQYYQEETNGGAKQIRFWPTPSTAIPLLIVGKKTFVPLVAGTDAPVVRNIDNCLLAFAIGDGLKRLRQVGKAQAQYAEAEKLYQELLALEKQQANVPRRTKTLTANGNSLAEMTDEVCSRCNDWMPDTRIVVKQFLRRNYQKVYDAALWPESLVMVNVPHDGDQCILPEYVGRVIAIRNNATGYASMGHADLSLYFGITPQIFDANAGGTPLSFSYLTPVGVTLLPPQREKLVIVSTSNADQGNVFIKGEASGMEVAETVQLNGTTSVTTFNQYDVPLTVSKLPSVGDVVISGQTSLIQLERIPAAEAERKHVRVWLQPRGTAGTALVLAKRRIKPLIQDEDTPLLTDVQNALILATTGDCFAKTKDFDSAQDARNQADTALKALLDLVVEQGALSPRVVPYIEPSPEQYAYSYAYDWFYQK